MEINKLITERWSPRAFRNKQVEKTKLTKIFEAGRWAASSRNEQPWRYIVGIKGTEAYDKIFDSLVEGNKKWAKNAPVLISILAVKNFDYKNKVNSHYFYDTGQSVATMLIQATELGLHGHQMGGFSSETLIENFEINETMEPVAILALGYKGDPDMLPEDLKKSEGAERKRRPLDEIILNSPAID